MTHELSRVTSRATNVGTNGERLAPDPTLSVPTDLPAQHRYARPSRRPVQIRRHSMSNGNEATRVEGGLTALEILSSLLFSEDYFLRPIQRDELDKCWSSLGRAEQACDHYREMLQLAERLAGRS